MKIETLRLLAAQIGFDDFAELNRTALLPRADVRAMCAANRCQRYGHSWSCPPACMPLSEVRILLASYKTGLLVQTVAPMSDDFDLPAIRQGEQLHKQRFDTLARQARQLDPTCLPMASGSCTHCQKCTYPDRPCRFPSKMFPSMEAYGLWVSDLCSRSQLAYNHGAQTITYTACILIKQEKEL